MSVEILVGDCRDRLAEMAPESVDCCVTSPPYFNQRDYGIEPVVWPWGRTCLDEDGKDCEHEWGDHQIAPANDSNRGSMKWTTGGDPAAKVRGEKPSQGQFCRRCHAWRGSLGLEPTPELYVAHLVEVFRAVWRVLRPTGTVWLNLGDSYAGSSGSGGATEKQSTNVGSYHSAGVRGGPGLKPKDLMMIPEQVALALRADGWWLRQKIFWHKPGPMPGSQQDRPTDAFEMIYLLSKSGTKRLWRHKRTRAWAERRPAPDWIWRHGETLEEVDREPDGWRDNMTSPWSRLNLWRGFDYWYDGDAIREPGEMRPQNRFTDGRGPKSNGYAPHRQPTGMTHAETRTARNVWTIATQPYAEAHFATFPVRLAERCILAGCPPGGTVLDPFGGAGTVGVAAEGAGRGAVLVEINEGYAAMATARVRAGLGRVDSEAEPTVDHGPLFAEAGGGGAGAGR